MDENTLFELVLLNKENIASLKVSAEHLQKSVERLDKRINGTFDTIGEHIKESPVYRTKVDILEQIVKDCQAERCKKDRAIQWRTGLIVGSLASLPALINIIFKLLNFWE